MVAQPKIFMIYTAIYLLISNPTPSYTATFSTSSITCDGGEDAENCQNDIINCISTNTCTVRCNVADRRRLLHSFIQEYGSQSSSRNLLWSCSSEDGGCCGVTVNCPVNNACNIDCNYRCHGLTVNAQQASTLSITNCDNCNEMTIHCPENGRGPVDNRCSLEIEDNISQLTVYAEESFFDFVVIGSYSISSSVMHCGDFAANIDHTCALKTDGTTCSNSGDTCVDYRIPTLDPTSDPTYDPTDNPSQSPSDYPSRSPTKSPTNYPSGSPTKFPTNYPSQTPTVETVYPSQVPSRFPTDESGNPSHDPTVDPIVDPTSDPSVDPTVDPTTDPSVDPTIDPTNKPTPAPTLPEGQVGEHSDGDEDLYENGQNELTTGNGSTTGTWIYIVIALAAILCCLLISIIAFKKRKKNIHAAKNLHFGIQTDANLQKVQSVSQLESPYTSAENEKYEGNGTTHAISAEDEDMNIFNDNNNNDQFGTYLSNNMVASNVLMDDIVENMCTPNGMDVILNDIPPPPPPQDHNPLIQMSLFHVEGGDGGRDRGVGVGSFVIEADDELLTGGIDDDGVLTAGGPMGGYDEVDDINNDVDDDVMVITAGGPMENDDELDDINNNVNNDDDDGMFITLGGPMGNDDEVDDINNVGDDCMMITAGGMDDDEDEIDDINNDMDDLDVIVTVGAPVPQENDEIDTVEGDDYDYDEDVLGDGITYGYDDDDDIMLNDNPLMTIQ